MPKLKNIKSNIPEILIRLAKVKEITTLSRSSIYLLESRGDFPKRIALSKRAVAWRQSQVQDWIDSRIEKCNGVTL